MSKIKICGLTRVCDIEAVNEYLPDYIGFVFAKSKRQVDADKARILKKLLDKRIITVGVFVNEDISTILKLYKNDVIDIIQLHGDEDNEYIRLLKQYTGKPIIKAVRVQGVQQLIESNNYDCDYLLFDTYAISGYGGTAIAFDWSILGQVEIKKPFFLAGGLNIGNVRQAVEQVSPYCLDISSGVETNGYKDKSKIKEIIKLIRSLT
jgi:phosphoribosylanthranilate isomerase